MKKIAINIALAFFALWMAAPNAVLAEPAPVLARVSISPQEGIWVGQMVTLQLDVLGRDGWAQIRNFPDIQIPGALVLRMESQGTRLQEAIGGVSYTGQRYEFMIFPKREGEIILPPTPVEVEVKSWGANAKAITQMVDTPPTSFQANLPPGAQNAQELVSTRSFKAQQQWDPEPDDFKVGDSLKRTFIFEAADLPGSAFTPLPIASIDGVDIYQDQPIVEDNPNRGHIKGQRQETITYMFTRPGKITLPDVEITWWDTNSEKLNREILKGQTLSIAPNPAIQDSQGSTSVPVAKSPFPTKLILSLVVIGIVLWYFRKEMAARWRAWNQQRQESESACFARFLKAVQANEPKEAFNALMAWLDKVQPGRSLPRIGKFLADYGDVQAEQEAAALIGAATSEGAPSWSGRSFANSMKKARARWLKATRSGAQTHGILPALNPTHRK